MTGSFRNFVDALDTSEGHILVMLALLVYFTPSVFWFDASWIQRLIDMTIGNLLKGLDSRRRAGWKSGRRPTKVGLVRHLHSERVGSMEEGGRPRTKHNGPILVGHLCCHS